MKAAQPAGTRRRRRKREQCRHRREAAGRAARHREQCTGGGAGAVRAAKGGRETGGTSAEALDLHIVCMRARTSYRPPRVALALPRGCSRHVPGLRRLRLVDLKTPLLPPLYPSCRRPGASPLHQRRDQPPWGAGNGATFYFLVFAILAGVVGAVSTLAGVHHVRSWRADSLAASAASALTAWAITALAFGLACKEIHVGGYRGWRLRVLEAFVILRFHAAALCRHIHGGLFSGNAGYNDYPGDHHHHKPATTAMV
ncbi:hypothetical protein GUJ93_ZPchr0010g8955 [Zizania palustris]|uniref:Uncharacterized protein n=1 Tax=Zizania palustris TaxID=103762 RepID=A0A8J6BHL8_ZIZPA|nr:hypothetical protein GUJ93_ZPchr0010g8955 [Zizania palustris]